MHVSDNDVANSINSDFRSDVNAQTRDAFLEQYIISLERELRNDTTVSAWVAKWQNESAVSIQTQFRNVTSTQNLNWNVTVIRFASIDDATNYANSNTAGLVTTNLTKVMSPLYKALNLRKEARRMFITRG